MTTSRPNMDCGRFRELAVAGAAEVIVRLPDLEDPASLERFAGVIAAFR